MLDPGGWPEVDEDALHDRAHEYTQALRQVTEVLETCQRQRGEIFDGGIWSGAAAGAANGELGTNIGELVRLQDALARVITWNRYVAAATVEAKTEISDNVEAADHQINVLENDANLDIAERTTAINTVVIATHEANVSVVAQAAEHILASKSWTPPSDALKDLLDQKTPPPASLPDTAPAEQEERPWPSLTPLTPVTSEPLSPAPVSHGGSPQAPLAPPAPTPAQPTPGTPVSPAPSPGDSSPTAPADPGDGPAAPLSPAASAAPLQPAASAGTLGAGGTGKGMTPASAPAGSTPLAARPEDSAATGPAGATGIPAGPMAGGGAGGGRAGRADGAGAKSAAAAGQKAPSTRPAATKPTAPRPASAARPKSPVQRAESADAVTVAPTIPVSAARAERDAIAEAATAEAARRAGPDPLQLARRIAAALNAPGNGGEDDFGFFWVTAVTTGGTIVVANSYGLAYIPDEVVLPEKVHMATADEAIPAAERARWATYPVLAVQGWAAHHGVELRAVIATKEQLANSDPGVAKVVLEPDDIPNSGATAGRSRLEVVDPEAADRLAATPDPRLTALLPPAPADASRPADLRPLLWFDAMKPFMSRASGREVAHLGAFQAYAAAAQEAVLSEAHTAVEPATQRSAVADWLYWKHVTGLLNAALANAS
ncbi:hypothetical protein A5641_10285 [Mycobacterium sp. 1554424.7]|nr:hypothetical protein A5641_10285 [Mycobacterium sp. 1554424.7]